MRALEAKDFLVQQTAEQAALENVPFSDLEKRMMYFTETDECPEDPIALNEAFEAEHDNDEYEAKISKLMHHAYRRVKKENPETRQQWDSAIRTLRKGDHYLLVFWDQAPQERPPYDSLKLLGTAILVIVAMAVVVSGIHFLGDATGIHLRGNRWNKAPFVQTSMPLWLQRHFWFLILTGYLYYVILPWILKRPLTGPGSIISKLFRRQSGGNSRR